MCRSQANLRGRGVRSTKEEKLTASPGTNPRIVALCFGVPSLGCELGFRVVRFWLGVQALGLVLKVSTVKGAIFQRLTDTSGWGFCKMQVSPPAHDELTVRSCACCT